MYYINLASPHLLYFWFEFASSLYKYYFKNKFFYIDDKTESHPRSRQEKNDNKIINCYNFLKNCANSSVLGPSSIQLASMTSSAQGEHVGVRD